MVGLGLTRLEPLRTFAASSVSSPGGEGIGGPTSGPYSIPRLRAAAAASAGWAGDSALADEIQDVCCWAPAATAIRSRPLSVQSRGFEHFVREFPGDDQLAQVLLYTNNTGWQKPRFRFEPSELVEQYYDGLDRDQGSVQVEIVKPGRLNGRASQAQLDLGLDRETGERLAKASDRSEAMWAALSILSGTMLDPSDELSRGLSPWLSLTRRSDRSLARTAAVRYNQIAISAAQHAIWSDLLDNRNPALPLLQLTAAGYLPLGEENGNFLLIQPVGGTHLVGYRSGNA